MTPCLPLWAHMNHIIIWSTIQSYWKGSPNSEKHLECISVINCLSGFLTQERAENLANYDRFEGKPEKVSSLHPVLDSQCVMNVYARRVVSAISLGEHHLESGVVRASASHGEWQCQRQCHHQITTPLLGIRFSKRQIMACHFGYL